MGRQPKENRDEVKTVVVGVKLSEAERTLLDRLAEARAAELEELTGDRLSVSGAAVIRWLMLKEARARGIPLGNEPRPTREVDPPDPLARARPATKALTPKASPAKGKAAKGRK